MFNWFKKIKNKKSTEESVPENVTASFTYDELIDITRLLTKNDQAAIEAITMLVKEPEKFDITYQAWLREIDLSAEESPAEVTFYLLSEPDLFHHFGGYIDWKEETQDIFGSLEDSIEKKHYPLDLQEVVYSEEDFTDEVLYETTVYLKEKGFTLVNWCTGGDSYCLFIIEAADYQELIALGNSINVKFHRFEKRVASNGETMIMAIQ